MDQNNEYGKKQEMVECHYNGAIVNIPVKLFMSMAMRTQYDNRKFVRYKEGAEIYGMSAREFNRLAHEAGAVYKRNSMALIKLSVIDEYMEFYKLEE